MKPWTRLAADNLRGIVCAIGAAWCYHGLAAFSRAAADTGGGLLLLAVGIYPYLRPDKKG